MIITDEATAIHILKAVVQARLKSASGEPDSITRSSARNSEPVSAIRPKLRPPRAKSLAPPLTFLPR